MNKFYVYLHRRGTDNSIFYVGKGSGCRATTKRGRNIYWQRTVDKHGIIIEYVDKNLSEKQAFELEEFLISFIGDSCSLCNLTSGGEGCSRGKDSKLSERNKNRTWTEEARLKISRANKGRKRSEESISASTLSGLRHGMSDKRIYVFQRTEDGLIVESTRSELCARFSLTPEQLKLLFGSKSRKSAKGWKLISTKDNT